MQSVGPAATELFARRRLHDKLQHQLVRHHPLGCLKHGVVQIQAAARDDTSTKNSGLHSQRQSRARGRGSGAKAFKKRKHHRPGGANKTRRDASLNSSDSIRAAKKHQSSATASEQNPAKALVHTQPFDNVRHKSFQELQVLAYRHGASARIAVITAAMSRLKQVARPYSKSQAALFKRLWQLLLLKLSHATPRHCTEAMLTASKLQCCPEGLFDVCMKQVTGKVSDAPPRIISNAIYAAATAPPGCVSADVQQLLSDVLVPTLLKQTSLKHSHTVANTMQVLAVLSRSNARKQLKQLLQAVSSSVWQGASARDVSTILWATGRHRVQLKEHFTPLLKRMLAVSKHALAPEIASSIYGLTLLGQRLTHQQSQHLTRALLQKQPSAQACSTFLWGVAKMGLCLQQKQVDALISQLLCCAKADLSPQVISLAIWGVACMERTVFGGSLMKLLNILAACPADARAISLSLWAAAKMEASMPLPLLDMLYGQLATVSAQATPQNFSNALWAAAVMQPRPYLPSSLLGDKQLWSQRQHHGSVHKHSKKGPHAKMGSITEQRTQSLQQQKQLQQGCVESIVLNVHKMKPLELSSTAVALALLDVKHEDVLDAVYTTAVSYLDAAQASANTAAASALIPGSINHTSGSCDETDTRLVEDISSKPASSGKDGGSKQHSLYGSIDSDFAMPPQAMFNLCWAGAILGLLKQKPQLGVLAEACSTLCSSNMAPQQAMQMYQFHLWLTEQAGVQGLDNCMSPTQLQHCRECAQRAILASPSRLQLQVYHAAQRVPTLCNVELEKLTRDGLLSVDVAALLTKPAEAGSCETGTDGPCSDTACKGVSAADSAVLQTCGDTSDESIERESPAGRPNDDVSAGQQVQQIAIEVDGPWHWRRPDQQPTGPTRFRNRLLANQGFLVVTVPYWEWYKLHPVARARYLQEAVSKAVDGLAAVKA